MLAVVVVLISFISFNDCSSSVNDSSGSGDTFGGCSNGSSSSVNDRNSCGSASGKNQCIYS